LRDFIIDIIHSLGTVLFAFGVFVLMMGVMGVATSGEGYTPELDRGINAIIISFVMILVGGIMVVCTDKKYHEIEDRRERKWRSK
jgi:hypothetical protein